MSNRIDARFGRLAEERRAGLVTFVTAGDPNPTESRRILADLPRAGADVIELGMPFSDPMADGPAIQKSSLRALKAGQTLAETLAMVAEFRSGDDATPIVLMGYYNPIFSYGVDRFLEDATGAGVDGLIVVDLPPEADSELCLPARACGLDFIRLATPTTDDRRLPSVLRNASGFLYYVSITGITGTRVGESDVVAGALARIRAHTTLPIAVGFGIRSPEQAARIAETADAVVVGSALVGAVEQAPGNAAAAVSELVEELKAGVLSARGADRGGRA